MRHTHDTCFPSGCGHDPTTTTPLPKLFFLHQEDGLPAPPGHGPTLEAAIAYIRGLRAARGGSSAAAAGAAGGTSAPACGAGAAVVLPALPLPPSAAMGLPGAGAGAAGPSDRAVAAAGAAMVLPTLPLPPSTAMGLPGAGAGTAGPSDRAVAAAGVLRQQRRCVTAGACMLAHASGNARRLYTIHACGCAGEVWVCVRVRARVCVV
jgi:hypothetical protein